MGEWIVYEHISPSGKVYVGITKQSPNKRWRNGTGYLRQDNHQPLMANAVKKYGWDNFTHNIKYSNLTLEEASSIEVSLIARYQNLGISYNITKGGEGWRGCKHTPESKEKIRRTKLGKKQSAKDVRIRIGRRISNYDYVVLTVKDNCIQSFRTSKEAALSLGIKNRCNISAAIAGKQCLVNGYYFMHWSKDIPIYKGTILGIASDFINFKYKRYDT